MNSIVSTIKPQPINLNKEVEISILNRSYLVKEVTHSSTHFLTITSSTSTTYIGSSISPSFISILMDVSQNIQFDIDQLSVVSMEIYPHLTASPIT